MNGGYSHNLQGLGCTTKSSVLQKSTKIQFDKRVWTRRKRTLGNSSAQGDFPRDLISLNNTVRWSILSHHAFSFIISLQSSNVWNTSTTYSFHFGQPLFIYFSLFLPIPPFSLLPILFFYLSFSFFSSIYQKMRYTVIIFIFFIKRGHGVNKF